MSKDKSLFEKIKELCQSEPDTSFSAREVAQLLDENLNTVTSYLQRNPELFHIHRRASSGKPGQPPLAYRAKTDEKLFESKAGKKKLILKDANVLIVKGVKREGYKLKPIQFENNIKAILEDTSYFAYGENKDQVIIKHGYNEVTIAFLDKNMTNILSVIDDCNDDVKNYQFRLEYKIKTDRKIHITTKGFIVLP